MNFQISSRYVQTTQGTMQLHVEACSDAVGLRVVARPNEQLRGAIFNKHILCHCTHVSLTVTAVHTAGVCRMEGSPPFANNLTLT